MTKIASNMQVEQAPEIVKEFDLSSGAKVKIFAGKGKHARKANAMIGEDRGRYQMALMSQLVEINGAMLTMEDFDDLGLQDYHNLVAEFSELNF